MQKACFIMMRLIYERVKKSKAEKWAATWENRIFAYAKTKTQISFAVTAKLISVFVFATRIVQSLPFLNTKFQASSHRLWLYSPVCVGPGRKPRRPVFSRRGSNIVCQHFLPFCSVCWIYAFVRFLGKCSNAPVSLKFSTLAFGPCKILMND